MEHGPEREAERARWEGSRAAAPPREPLERLVGLAEQLLAERRRARRWSLLFKLALLAIVAAALWLPRAGWQPEAGERHAALVSVEGVIAPGIDAGGTRVLEGLKRALADKRTAGVILDINSPGGSPVQAAQIYAEVLRLRAAHPKVPIYAVISDIGASGGYYIAAAAQAIYADRASLVGSIGVRTDSFGFQDAIGKLGIERRLYTAGGHKGMLDPFQPSRPDDVAHLQTMLDTIHRQFIAAVKAGRGERLKNDPVLFSGLVWTGEQALALGLIDGYGSARSVAREQVGVDKLVDFTPRERVIDKLFERVEASLAGALTRALGLELPLR